MAKSGLKHIDVGAELTKTEWESEDSHELLHGSSFPGSPVERQLFYRDDEHKWYIYNASAWVWLGGGGGGMVDHGNEYHTPDFAEASHGHAQLHTQLCEAADFTKLDGIEAGADVTANHNPKAHKTSHQDAGTDEISLAGLDGEPSTLATHKNLATGIHGVGASTVESASGSQAKVDTHAGLTDAHSAASAATPSRIILRDASARAKVAAPSAADDIARKDTVDTHAGIDTGVHGVGGSTVESVSGSQAKVDVHKVITTAVHGVGGSTVESASGAQAKVDAHKDLATGAHGVGSNYVAQAPAASHLVRAFSKGWTSGKHLKGAGVDADPAQVGSWEVIAEIDVASACTYVDFTSLDGNADEFFILLATLLNATGTGYSVAMYVNGDYTDSHYHAQVIDATGSTLLAANYNYPYVGGFGANSQLNVMAYINRDPSGYYRYYTFTHRFLGASTDIQNWAGNKNDATISNITSLRILTGTNAIAIGSKFMLCRVRSG